MTSRASVEYSNIRIQLKPGQKLVELRSPDQSLPVLQKKMQECLEMGALLGWLIDPQNKKAYVYSGESSVKTIGFEEVLYGEPVLEGFQIRMAELLST